MKFNAIYSEKCVFAYIQYFKVQNIRNEKQIAKGMELEQNSDEKGHMRHLFVIFLSTNK